MAVFVRGRPIKTTAPSITVEKLPPGRHEFQLVVVDEAGNRSKPDRVAVVVVKPRVAPRRP